MDDEDYGFSALNQAFVQTDPVRGLTKANADAAIRILRRTIPN
jgi:hypothetical protein